MEHLYGQFMFTFLSELNEIKLCFEFHVFSFYTSKIDFHFGHGLHWKPIWTCPKQFEPVQNWSKLVQNCFALREGQYIKFCRWLCSRTHWKKMGSETSPLKKRFIRWMEDNRGLILTVIGLPASFLFDLVMRVSIFRLMLSNF